MELSRLLEIDNEHNVIRDDQALVAQRLWNGMPPVSLHVNTAILRKQDAINMHKE